MRYLRPPEGVAVRPRCLEPCVLSCFWGCGVNALQGALQSHQNGPRLSIPRLFEEALQFQYHHCQTFQYLDKHPQCHEPIHRGEEVDI